jgi:diguanylate cyclase (GGDEF)-like protein
MPVSRTKKHLSLKYQQILAIPVTILLFCLLLIVLAYGFITGLDTQQVPFIVSITVVGIIYGLFVYFFIIPYLGNNKVFGNGITLVHAVAIGAFWFLQPSTLLQTSLLFALLVLIATVILFGRFPGYFFLIGTIFTRQFLLLFTPDAFNPPLIYETIFYLILSIAIIETLVAYARREIKNLQSLETMNSIARNLASTIELNHVFSLLSETIQKELHADTYSIGIIHGNRIQMELFSDDGDYFNGIDIPLENTLTSWVCKNRKTLLISNFLKEATKLNVTAYLVGHPRINSSWMGTPIIVGGEVYAVLSVASYHPNAFSLPERDLLEFIAQQASLALDNANHHNSVELQSRTDSLTGTLNHRYFLEALKEATKEAILAQSELSLIMLDIDFFKQYNDNYGHLVGDQVLEIITTTIQKHIKHTDLVGRWGGEEFVIALQGASGAQAYQVALRIRRSLAAIKICGRDGQLIPPPTISQGIAIFPRESTDYFQLIDLADQRLYQAKERGRDQIEPKPEFWEPDPLVVQ